MNLEIELPWPPRGLSPNARLQVFAKAKLFKSTKLLAGAVTKRALLDAGIDRVILAGAKDAAGHGGVMNLQLFCTPPINRYRDEDNLIANCKAYFDGVADAMRINDTVFHFREQVWHDAEKPGKLIVRFDWEEEHER